MHIGTYSPIASKIRVHYITLCIKVNNDIWKQLVPMNEIN